MRTNTHDIVDEATDPSGSRYAVASIKTVHLAFAHWARPVRVTLRERQGVVDVVGVERPFDSAQGRPTAVVDAR